MIGPEILSSASLENPAVKAMLSNYFGNKANHEMLKMTTDDAPELMSQTAAANYFRFFPAGFSFAGADHFRDMICTGKFTRRNKYDGHDPEEYDHTLIKNETKITLVTGQADLLSSPGDYNWLQETLKTQGVDISQIDFPHGHLALVMPSDFAVKDKIFESVKQDY